LITYPKTPASHAASKIFRSVQQVKKITPTFKSFALIRRATSIPFRPGIDMSRTATSGISCVTANNAVLPSPTANHVKVISEARNSDLSYPFIIISYEHTGFVMTTSI
jgi:hypothetical protein